MCSTGVFVFRKANKEHAASNINGINVEVIFLDAYSAFAQVYDTFMDNVPYEEWGRRLHALLLEEGIADGLVLALG